MAVIVTVPVQTHEQEQDNQMTPKTQASNGAEIKPAPRTGPKLEVRLRNRDLKRAIAKAAKKRKLSVNTYVNEVLTSATA